MLSSRIKFNQELHKQNPHHTPKIENFESPKVYAAQRKKLIRYRLTLLESFKKELLAY